MRDFAGFAGRSALLHTLTYLVFGLAARSLLGYEELWQQPPVAELYRPLDSPWVLAGPLLQPLRGVLYAAVLWPLRGTLVAMERGWLVIWGLFVGLAILGTAAAAPGSIEGVIYTRLPFGVHLRGSPEIYGQTLAYAWLLFHWERAGATQGAAFLWLRSFGVVMAAFFGIVAAGVVSAAVLAVEIDELSRQPGASAVLAVALLANLALALLLGRRAREGADVPPALAFALFYAANALPSLATNATALTLAVQLLPAALAWGTARLLFRAPAAA